MDDRDFEQIGQSDLVDEINRLGLEDPDTSERFEKKPFTRHDLNYFREKGEMNLFSVMRGRIKQYTYIRRDAKWIHQGIKELETGRYTVKGAMDTAREALKIPTNEESMQKYREKVESGHVASSKGEVPISPQMAEYIVRKLEEG